MKVWVDGQCLQTASRIRGIGRYCIDFLRYLQKQPEIDLHISFNARMPFEGIGARELVSGYLPSGNIHLWHGMTKNGEAPGGYTPERRLSELALTHHVNCLAPDIALSVSPFEGILDQATPIQGGSGLIPPLAGIFYDAIPYRMPKQYLTTRRHRETYLRRLAGYRAFDCVLCISDFSRRECVEITGNPNAINIMAALSTDIKTLVESRETPPAPVEGAYLLYVGAADWRKNVPLIPEAYRHLPEDLRQSLTLVLAGPEDPDTIRAICATWAAQGLPESQLVRLGHVADAVLVGLYRHASIVVQPSRMEGFGLSALEAMACGAPVLAADAGALPEVVGRRDVLFPADSAEALAAQITRVRRDPEWRQEIIDSGLVQAGKFGWDGAAERAAGALRKVVEATPRTPAPDRARLRSDTAARVRSARVQFGRVPVESAARLFALAEPGWLPPEKRLIIDVTHTADSGLGTGIQRVVRNIVDYFQAGVGVHGLKPVLSSAKDATGWRDLPSIGAEYDPGPEALLRITPADTLLMLDSSWGFVQFQQRALTAARLQGGDVICVLYDLAPIRFPAMCHEAVTEAYVAWLQQTLRFATGVVCISKAVADEFLNLLEAIDYPNPMKVGHWPLGADFHGAPAEPRAGGGGSRRRFLMIGTLEPRKGYNVALDAFDRLRAKGVDLELTIVGKQGWRTEALAARIRAHPDFGAALRWETALDDDGLQALYKSSDALLATSYGEGFGLPLVEAGYFGLPVIASDLPVFYELKPGLPEASFFKTGDAAALAARIEAFMAAPDRPAGKAARWPNWRDSAERLGDVALGGDWYRHYTPKDRKSGADLGAIGKIALTGALSPEAMAHRIELVTPPEMTEDAEHGRFMLRLHNLSDQTWSGVGDDSGRYRIRVTCDLLDGAGMVTREDAGAGEIPFVTPPGDSVYLSVTAPLAGGERVRFHLEQVGVRRCAAGLETGLERVRETSG